MRVALDRAGEQARLRISDTGEGIGPEDLQHIFDRFYRADKARSRGTGGAGLGLAIVKWIVEAHSGSVEVASTPGQGSTFALKLPLGQLSDPPAPQARLPLALMLEHSQSEDEPDLVEKR